MSKKKKNGNKPTKLEKLVLEVNKTGNVKCEIRESKKSSHYFSESQTPMIRIKM